MNPPIWCWAAEKGCFASCITNPHYHSQKAHGKLITMRKQIKHKKLNIYTHSYMHIHIWGKIPSTQTGNNVSTTSREKAFKCFRQDLQLFSYWTKCQNTHANFSNGNLMCAAQQSEKGKFTLGLWSRHVHPYLWQQQKQKSYTEQAGKHLLCHVCINHLVQPRRKRRAWMLCFPKRKAIHDSASLSIQPIHTTEC